MSKADPTPLLAYYCWDCGSHHTALEPCNDLGGLVSETCLNCLGDGEVSVPTPTHYRGSDIDTVPCSLCGGKGTIGRKED